MTQSNKMTGARYALMSIYEDEVARVFATSSDMGPKWGSPEIQKFLQKQASAADLRNHNAMQDAASALNHHISHESVDELWAAYDKLYHARVRLLAAEADMLGRIRALLANNDGMFSFFQLRRSRLQLVN